MKHFTFDENWEAVKGRLKERFGQLTDDDLVFVEGKGEELMARLRAKLGFSQEELDETLDELSDAVGGAAGHIKNRLGDFANDARSKASEVAGDLKSKAAAMGEEAKAQASAVYSQARQRARTWREEGEEYVRQNPRESLILAVCAGFIAGLLIRR